MRGFTLLEILFAVSILLIGLLAIMKLSDLVQRESLYAEEIAIVQLATQTKMNELLANVGQPVMPVAGLPISGVRNWFLSVEIAPVPQRSGLLAIRIKTQKTGNSGQTGSSEQFELVRWVLAKT